MIRITHHEFSESLHWSDTQHEISKSLHWSDTQHEIGKSLHWSDTQHEIRSSLHWSEAQHEFNKSLHWSDTQNEISKSLHWSDTQLISKEFAKLYTCWNAALQDVALHCRMISARSFRGFKYLHLQIYPEVDSIWSYRMSETTTPKQSHRMSETITPQLSHRMSETTHRTMTSQTFRSYLHLNDFTDCQKQPAPQWSHQLSETICPTTQHHIPEHLHLQLLWEAHISQYMNKCSLLTCIQPSK